MKGRLIVLAVVGLGVWLWRDGFGGLLATERTLVFQLPVPHHEIRRVELEVWDEGSLFRRVVEELPRGLDREPTLKVSLARGPHRAVATVWQAGAPDSRSFALDFDPGSADEVGLVFHRGEEPERSSAGSAAPP